MKSTRPGLVVLILVLLPGQLPGDEGARPRAIDYPSEIKPIFSRHCYACHGPLHHKAGLRLDTAVLMKQGGSSGPALVPGDTDESLIVDAITGRDGWRMPPESEAPALSAGEIAKIAAWIEQGAKAPADERPQPDPRDHWSFRSPARPELPAAAALGGHARWARNPIDAFLALKQLAHGLKPRPAADPATLIRRVTLDLTGLLPSPEAVRRFVADPSEAAYEAVVDKLLASPQYGERWGRHWMDVWRYSDWDGFGAEVRESQPHIWRWRDWIIESLNRDMPYDRMIIAMLAADEAAPGDADSLRATGFLVRNWYKFNRNVWLENTVEHTAKAFLGITLNCARCHDHKYDPIAQTEYYAFRAFFEPHTIRTDRVPGQPDLHEAGLVHVYDNQPVAPTFLFQRGDEKFPIKTKPLAPAVPMVLQLQARLGLIRPVTLPAEAFYPGLRSFIREETVAQARRLVLAQKAAVIAAEKALAGARDESAAEQAQWALAEAKKGQKAADAELAAVQAAIAADAARYAEPARPEARALVRAAAGLDRKRTLLKAEDALLRAEIAYHEAKLAAKKQPVKPRQNEKVKATHDEAAKAAQEEKDAFSTLERARAAARAARQLPGADASSYAPLSPIYPTSSTGRRLALARWITDPNNPLTARVAVNQIWIHHFGTPLVPSVFDFGRNGVPPAFPALLDWLAVQLRAEGWRMKPIHHLLVTSAAYRMQSASAGPDDPNLAHDRANMYYWRMNPKRMEAEAVRDNLLYLAGSLDQTFGGPDLDHAGGMKSGRRSVYFRHAKEKRVLFLRLFDSPNVLSCYRRSESVVPQQALALANSPLSIEQARLLARKLSREVPPRRAPFGHRSFVTALFERVLGRVPTPEEQTTCGAFLESQAKQLADRAGSVPIVDGPALAVAAAADPVERAREDLVHVLFNHNDFVTIR
jgi:hypothetical protein